MLETIRNLKNVHKRKIFKNSLYTLRKGKKKNQRMEQTYKCKIFLQVLQNLKKGQNPQGSEASSHSTSPQKFNHTYFKRVFL